MKDKNNLVEIITKEQAREIKQRLENGEFELEANSDNELEME
ncbi:hypothetical protein [Williamsoniiplasma lucivorax]|uniref:Uncharacterized protein n=1 Tax=Williamsoniiplasma lucivorax TaxID=209274 RepID=A0A2S5RDN0_9MOLU|nr:hypothetical protein [Williamsoniiplasma lucivorax]PPE05420.1 hypothetical protein ELUCI_v1c05120 [Williamsoniiplasma lucivorax]